MRLRVCSNLSAAAAGEARPTSADPAETSRVGTATPVGVRHAVGVVVVSGRLIRTQAYWTWTRTHKISSPDGDTSEELVFTGNGAVGSARYKRTGPSDDFSVEINSEGGFRFERHGKKPGVEAIAFSQSWGEPLVSSVGSESKRQVYHAPTLWRLLASCSRRSAASICFRYWKGFARNRNWPSRSTRWRRNS